MNKLELRFVHSPPTKDDSQQPNLIEKVSVVLQGCVLAVDRGPWTVDYTLDLC